MTDWANFSAPPHTDDDTYAAIAEYQRRLAESAPARQFPLHLGYAEGMLTVHEDGSHTFETWAEHNGKPDAVAERATHDKQEPCNPS